LWSSWKILVYEIVFIATSNRNHKIFSIIFWTRQAWKIVVNRYMYNVYSDSAIYRVSCINRTHGDNSQLQAAWIFLNAVGFILKLINWIFIDQCKNMAVCTSKGLSTCVYIAVCYPVCFQIVLKVCWRKPCLICLRDK